MVLRGKGMGNSDLDWCEGKDIQVGCKPDQGGFISTCNSAALIDVVIDEKES